jgi:hypothetical protein
MVAFAVITNSRATEPTNSFMSVVIVATEANILRCDAVEVRVIEKNFPWLNCARTIPA